MKKNDNNMDDFLKFFMKHINNAYPKVIEKDTDYLDSLETALRDYSEAVREYDCLQDEQSEIDNLIENILEAVKLTYEGKTAEAYTCIKAFTDAYNGYLACIKNLSEISCGTEYKTLYRGRRAEEITELKEMFHRPFSQRAFIPTERYSIPGLPCLYLGGSAYICWREIGKPSHDQFYVSRFEADENVKILDLAPPIRQNKKETDKFRDYCVIWPLVCACSFKVKEKNRIFHSEYIIPQLLMQVVINTDNLDGIRYVSSHKPSMYCGYIAPLYISYAFPAPYEANKQYSSSLIKKFKATCAICMHDLSQLSAANKLTVKNSACENGVEKALEIQYENSSRRFGTISIDMNSFSEYEHTSYFKTEDMLYKFPAKDIEI